jgi:hypothetical protein
VNLDDRDKGRILLATVITLIALPAIWLLNRSEDNAGSARPNVAAAGLSPGNAGDTASTAETASQQASSFDPMGSGGAAYLEAKPMPASVPVPVVAVGSTPGEFVANASATYRNSVAPGECQFNGAAIGEDVTVINVANERSIKCEVAFLSGAPPGTLVMNTVQFRQLADLIAAPIHVEVRR